MSECSLPNVDIFDPVQCTKRWNQCATQQQINVYLNAEIVRTQECLQLFKTAQQGVNDILDGKIKNHESRIATLESAQAELKQAQANLQANFNSLSASNTQFQTDVDKTLKLYQSSINSVTSVTNTLTAEQQSMWNEINALKSTIDPAKIEAAIAGYDAIMSQTKALIEENNKKVAVDLQSLKNDFTAFEVSVNSQILEGKSEQQKLFKDFTGSVEADITAQNARINAYFKNSDSNIASFKEEVNSRLALVESQVSEFEAKLEAHKAEVAKEISEHNASVAKDINSISERVAVEEQARKDGDNRLQGIIDANEKSVAQKVDSLDKNLNQKVDALDKSIHADFDALSVNTDNKLLQQYKDAVEREDAIAKHLSSKIDSEVEKLQLQEAADVKTINQRIDKVEKDGLVYTDSEVSKLNQNLSTRITNVESDLRSAISSGDDANASAISKLKADNDLRFDGIDGDITNLHTAINTVDEKQTLAVENEANARKEGDDKLASAIDSLDSKTSASLEEVRNAIVTGDEAQKEYAESLVAPLQESVSSVTSRVDIIEESDAKQWTTINNTVESNNITRKAVDSLETRVDALEKGSGGEDEGLAERVDAIDADNKANAEKIESNTTAISANAASIETLNTSVTELSSTIDGVDQLSEQLDGRLSVAEGLLENVGKSPTTKFASGKSGETKVAVGGCGIAYTSDGITVSIGSGKVCYIETDGQTLTMSNNTSKSIGIGKSFTIVFLSDSSGSSVVKGNAYMPSNGKVYLSLTEFPS